MDIMLEVILFLMHPKRLLLLLGGSALGTVFGAIPGLSGGLCIMLMLPMTFSMEANNAIAFLMSIYIGGISGGCIGSILLDIPGCESSLATTYDGYAMTKKGECVRALSAAVVANFLGTVPSVLIASVAARSLARMAMKIGPWEFFALGLCAIVLVITLSRGNICKGLIAAALGILCTCIGIAPIDGAQRFTFGNAYLMSGLILTYSWEYSQPAILWWSLPEKIRIKRKSRRRFPASNGRKKIFATINGTFSVPGLPDYG